MQPIRRKLLLMLLGVFAAPRAVQATGFWVRGVLERDTSGEGYYAVGKELVIATPRRSPLQAPLDELAGHEVLLHLSANESL